MMEDDYPTPEQLERIKTWPFGDFPALFTFIDEEVWNQHYGWFDVSDGVGILSETVAKARCATGGWSGNEDVIGALMENRAFWWTCWESSTRGGGFTFEPPIKELRP